MLYTLIITWKEMNKVEWTLPGTVLSVDADRPQAAEDVFSSLFLAGGLVLSQVTQVTGLEPYIIQNWVRRGFLAPPKQRKYTRRQLSRILMINALKSTLSIEQICKLLSYINGALDDEGDDTIDDTELYGAFVLVAGSVQKHGLTSESEMNRLIADGLKDYKESIPGAKERIEQALRIMITAWRAASVIRTASRVKIISRSLKKWRRCCKAQQSKWESACRTPRLHFSAAASRQSTPITVWRF